MFISRGIDTLLVATHHHLCQLGFNATLNLNQRVYLVGNLVLGYVYQLQLEGLDSWCLGGWAGGGGVSWAASGLPRPHSNMAARRNAAAGVSE